MSGLLDLLQDPARLFGWQGILAVLVFFVLHGVLVMWFMLLLMHGRINIGQPGNSTLSIGLALMGMMLLIGMVFGQIAHRAYDSDTAIWWLFGTPLFLPVLGVIAKILAVPGWIKARWRRRRELKEEQQTNFPQQLDRTQIEYHAMTRHDAPTECTLLDLLMIAKGLTIDRGRVVVDMEMFQEALRRVDSNQLELAVFEHLPLDKRSAGRDDAYRLWGLGISGKVMNLSSELATWRDEFMRVTGLGLGTPIEGLRIAGLATDDDLAIARHLKARRAAQAKAEQSAAPAKTSATPEAEPVSAQAGSTGSSTVYLPMGIRERPATALVERLGASVFGQAWALQALGRMVQRWQAGFSPAGVRVIVLAGPAQTGKTLAATCLAEELDEPVLLLPMASFRSQNEGFGLTGLRAGYDSARAGTLTSFLRENPRGTVILDQLDLAHHAPQELLLPLFTRGELEDAYGFGKTDEERHADRLVNARHATVIITLRAGQNLEGGDLRAQLEQDAELAVARIRDELQLTRSSSTDNRETHGLSASVAAVLASQPILPMAPLAMADLVRIAQRRLDDLVKHVASKGIELQLEQAERLALLEVLQLGPDLQPAEVARHAGDVLVDRLLDWVSTTSQGMQRQITYGVSPEALSVLEAHWPSHAEPAKRLELLRRQCFRRREQLRCDLELQPTSDTQAQLQIMGIRFERVMRVTPEALRSGLVAELPTQRFADIFGQEGVKQRLAEILRMLRTPTSDADLLPRGMLLYGRPGTGKTMLAKALAAEADLPFLTLAGSQLLHPRTVQELFVLARQYAPSIVFLDEIDALGVRAQGGHVESINQLLAEIDGFRSSEGRVFVVAATNFPERVDGALVRSGRLDLRLEVPVLDREARRAFLSRLSSLDWAEGVWTDTLLDELLNISAGMSGADMAKLRRELALLGMRMQRPLARADVLELVHTLKYGARESRPTMAEDHRRALAFHEAGHAVASRLLNPERPIEQVSIIARAGAAGFMALGSEVEAYVPFDRREVLDALCVLLAGRVSEQRCRREQTGSLHRGPDAGDVSDLQRASRLARLAVTQWGMDEVFGWLSVEDEASLSAGAEELALERQRAMLHEARKACEALLDAHWQTVVGVAQALLDEETLQGARLDQVLPRAGVAA